MKLSKTKVGTKAGAHFAKTDQSQVVEPKTV